MVAIVKPNLTRVWAAGAPGANVVDPDTTTPGKFDDGWDAEIPPFEHFNFLQQLFTQGLGYLNEQGIGEWDTDTEYSIDSIAKGSNGGIYRSLTDTNTGNDPITDFVNWVPALYGENGLYNPNMAVSRRGDFTSPTAIAHNIYYLDRWLSKLSGVSATITHILDGYTEGVNTVKYIATSTATGLLGADQLIEDYNKYRGKKVTFSALVKSNSSDARLVVFDDSSAIGSDAHTGGGGFEILHVTVTVGTSITALRPLLRIGSAAGSTVSITSGDYIEFTKTRSDISSHRLSGDRELVQEEILCDRYFEQLDASSNDIPITIGQCVSTTSITADMHYTPKRIAPSVTLSAASGGFTYSRATGSRIFDVGAAITKTDFKGCQLTVTGSGLVAGDASKIDQRSIKIDIDAEMY